MVGKDVASSYEDEKRNYEEEVITNEIGKVIGSVIETESPEEIAFQGLRVVYKDINEDSRTQTESQGLQTHDED